MKWRKIVFAQDFRNLKITCCNYFQLTIKHRQSFSPTHGVRYEICYVSAKILLRMVKVWQASKFLHENQETCNYEFHSIWN